MAQRILAGIILLISVLFLPLWVSVFLAFAGMVYFPIFLEAVFLFLLSDLLYGLPEAKFQGGIFISFFIFLAAIITIEFFKRKLRFYS